MKTHAYNINTSTRIKCCEDKLFSFRVCLSCSAECDPTFVSSGDPCKVGLENPICISRMFYTVVLVVLKSVLI